VRLIGHIEDRVEAERFAGYLYLQGFANDLEESSTGGWAIWVHDEDKLAEAGVLLQAFRGDPTHERYRGVTEQAAGKRAAEARGEAEARKRMKGADEMFGRGLSGGAGPVTLVLIGVSVLLFLLYNAGPGKSYPSSLYVTTVTMGDHTYEYAKGLPEIRDGQVWRIFTPALIHFGFIHLLFNMLWLRDLGGMVERAESSLKLAALFLLIAGCSNLAQYAESGPLFGGMSGVVYGLLGYIWIKGKFDPWCGLHLHQSTVTMMLVWYFICLLGLMPIANTVHTVGLLMGMGWGFLSAKMRKP
jgi:GlpG protein